MIKEKSCGAVIYKIENKEIKFLITKHVLGHYSFTKGHVENNETEVETALREIKEEVNLDVVIDTNFREIVTYCPKANVIKDVIFFVATPTSNDIICQKEEVQLALWVDYKEALNLITNDSDKEILKKAYAYLK